MIERLSRYMNVLCMNLAHGTDWWITRQIKEVDRTDGSRRRIKRWIREVDHIGKVYREVSQEG